MKIVLPPKLKKFIDTVMCVSGRIARDRITVYAAQASFFVIISAIPFVMLLIALLQIFMPIEKEQMLNFSSQYFPSAIIDFANVLINEMFTKARLSVLSVTAIAILWSSSKGLSGISNGLKNVYKSPPRKVFIFDWFFSLVYTLMFIAIMIASVVILVFGKYILNSLRLYTAALAGIIDKLMLLRSGVFLIFLTFIFMLAYKALAKSEIPFRSQFLGALFASSGWLVFSFGYSIYINTFSNYSYIYGSLAAIVLLMLWLYMCMIILLLGAELNMWLYERKRKKCEFNRK